MTAGRFYAIIGLTKRQEQGMVKFVPFEKLSKKEQQKKNAARRGSWNGVNPVTRRPDNPKAYNRQKAQKRMDSDSVSFVLG